MNAAELKKSLTVDDIITLVTKGLGSGECYYDQDGNPIFQTVCHNEPGHGKYKLYYYIESQMFHCYTQCGDSFDVYELIQRAGKADNFVEAYHFISDFFGFNFSTLDFEENTPELTSDWDLLNKYENYSRQEEKHKETKIIPKSLLSYFNPLMPAVWYQEGISLKAMSKYNICMDAALEKIIIPHFNVDGELIGIRGRTYNWVELQDGKKYAPVYIENTMYNHPLGENLYGLNFNKDAIQRMKKVVIVEGEKSVLKAETFYPKNNFTVAACGSSISDAQVNLLLSLGVNEIIIAFDKENDDIVGSTQTLEYKNKLISLGQKFTPYVNVYVVFDTEGRLDYKDSPFDKGKKILEYLLSRKQLIPCLNINLQNKKSKR